jgi:hypothetical protein
VGQKETIQQQVLSYGPHSATNMLIYSEEDVKISDNQRTMHSKQKPNKLGQKVKTYNSRYSLVVTHPTTNLPIYSLYMGERTGSLVLCSLWSYVVGIVVFKYIYMTCKFRLIFFDTLDPVRPAMRLRSHVVCGQHDLLAQRTI